MGCDIHVHVEVKIKGKWEHYSAPMVERNYDLFAVLAGVRGDFTFSMAPKGLPEGLSLITSIDVDIWEGTSHSHSYLMASEIAGLSDKLLAADVISRRGDIEYRIFRCYIFRNRFDDHICYPDDCGKWYKKHGIEDVRIVFWFDN